ncbi:hypothetical protein PR202_gb19165 [Eleusine coracana subsp. coracana]|uniref:Acid phosphatase n=1 Tax=Eleusine coracana subsp. coracana TaxID=191504 RepID=A0AAV5F6X7_ELECO|nr:hypothetical protein PR202_gb19165 [Eleusine coracana subsp. coracana]
METAALALLAVTAALVMCAPAAAELARVAHESAKNDGALSLLVVGDWGRKGAYNQSRVAEQMGRVGDELNIEFVISTGDNFYEDGLTGVDDPAFEQSFTDIYTAKSLQKPCPIQYFTSGGGSKAWRGYFQPNEDKLKFFYDGQGFMSLQLDQDQADFTFYDVDGNILYQYSQCRSTKTYLLQHPSYLTDE